MNTAAKVAETKRKHPHLYCSDPRCLWRTGGGDCPRHKQTICAYARCLQVPQMRLHSTTYYDPRGAEYCTEHADRLIESGSHVWMDVEDRD